MGCEFEAQCAVQALLFFLFFPNLFIDLYGYIYFSSCFYGFLFSFFLLLKLIDCIVFSFANLFEAVNFFGDNFFPCCWRPYRLLSILILSTDSFFFSSLSLLCLFASVVVLSAKRKICLGLLKRRFYLVKLAEKADG